MSWKKKLVAGTLAGAGLGTAVLAGAPTASALPALPDGCQWNPFPSWTPSDAGYCLIDGQWWWFDWNGGYGMT